MRFAPALYALVAAAGISTAAGAQMALDPMALRDIDDFDVYLADGTEVGDIEEVLIDSTGAIVAVKVDLEDRFGGHDVVFPIGNLVFDNGRYVTEMTEA
ncbi:MAG: PRC-barrel domain-containing protein, partial [Pararhodobacter sp.]